MGEPSRIARVIEHEEAGSPVILVTPEGLLEQIRSELPLVCGGRLDDLDRAADDSSLGQVGNPARTRYDDLAVEGQLQEEHQFLGAGPYEYAIGMGGDPIVLAVECRNRLAQGGQAAYGQVVLFRRRETECLYHGIRHGERRLPQSEPVHVAAGILERFALFVDAEGGRDADSANVQVEADRFARVHEASLESSAQWRRETDGASASPFVTVSQGRSSRNRQSA